MSKIRTLVRALSIIVLCTLISIAALLAFAIVVLLIEIVL